VKNYSCEWPVGFEKNHQPRHANRLLIVQTTIQHLKLNLVGYFDGSRLQE
jgi:hypothetical protein